MCGRCCERAERTHINKSCVDATVASKSRQVKEKNSAEVRSFTVHVHVHVLE